MSASKEPIIWHRAPFALRCGALLIDYTVIVGILAFLTLVARPLGGGARRTGSSIETLGYVLMFVMFVFNFIVWTMWRGLTFGKWATGLRIERVNGQRVGLRRALLRHVIGYPLSLATLGIGFLWAAFDRRGRGLHDRLAGTIVVHEATRRPPRRSPPSSSVRQPRVVSTVTAAGVRRS